MKIFDSSLSAQIGGLLLIVTTLERIIPGEFWATVNRFVRKVVKRIFNPYVEITFDEFPSEIYGRSKAYDAIQKYLGTNFSGKAAHLKASVYGESCGVALSMNDNEEITEAYQGAKVTWLRIKILSPPELFSYRVNNEKRAYILSFHRKHRDVVIRSYLSHVMAEGKAIIKRGRRQRLYTNVSGDDWGSDDKMTWKSVGFHHPATFDTLAMDPKKKKEIMDDLTQFTKAKDHYQKIGKPWKRGYLLHGPPGTGKSTMIAAIANFLHYDVYDLELTAVKDNTMLRKLMIEISRRAIVVIEDIDCSLHITGRRKKNKRGKNMDDSKKDDLLQDAITKAKAGDGDDKEDSKVTLSGLLNFMDGLWSASGGERIFVFTTNHVDKIDDALIRRGRMDKHIEMSYCTFEAFKVLAMNYLNLKSHAKFENIRCLLSETEISTADVAESLIPTSPEMSADECLESLIAELQKVEEEDEEEKEEGAGEGEEREEGGGGGGEEEGVAGVAEEGVAAGGGGGGGEEGVAGGGGEEEEEEEERRENEVFRCFKTRLKS